MIRLGLLAMICVVLGGCVSVGSGPVSDTKAQEAIRTVLKSTYTPEGLRCLGETKKAWTKPKAANSPRK